MSQNLKRLLSPQTLAIFGGTEAEEVIRQCRKLGFAGDIWGVNPGRDLLADVPTYRQVSDLPAAPDASFIAIPPAASVAVISELAASGAPGAVVYPAGFAETGEASGKQLQRDLKRVAGDMEIIGPNCHGYINYLDRVALWPDQHGGIHVDKGAALILQSGNVAINLTMQQRGLSVSHVISIGNMAVTRLHEYIDTLLDDPRVTAIGLYLEGLDDIQGLSSVAIRALERQVPIVAMKTGRSELGAEMTLSHTSSLSAADALCTLFFERYGIARCDSLAQFLETLKFLSVGGSLAGTRIGSMSCSGGEASMVADISANLNMTLPELTPQTRERLSTILGPKVHVANPLDYHTYIWGDYEKLSAAFAAMLDNHLDCVLLVLDYPLPGICSSENWETTERALIDAAQRTGAKAAIVATLPETLPADARLRLHTAGIAAMQGLEDCLYALRAAAIAGQTQTRVHALSPMPNPVQLSGSRNLGEWDSKVALAKHGLEIPKARLCDAASVAEAVDAIGYPVVIKAVSAELSHKTEAGAVHLNIRNPEDVRKALTSMQGRFQQFLVEEMIDGAIAELIVGVHRDPTFGPTLLLGAGGVLAELISDTVELLFPINRDDILHALESLKVVTLLRGYRGAAAANIDTIVAAVEAIAEFARENAATLVELDVNPLIVTTQRAIAVDAFVRST